MDDQKLEKLHNDLKRNADSRGGRGGLGKGSNNSKRIQIEYNPVEEQTTKATSSDPKHLFIKFVPASDSNGKQSKEKESKTSENKQTNKKKIEFSSDNEDDEEVQINKEPQAAKKSSEISRDSSIRTYSLINLENGADLVSSLSKARTIANGIGTLAKASLKTLTGKKIKAKDCFLVSLKKELPDSEMEVTIIQNIEGEESTSISGVLRKAKVGNDGVVAAISL